MTALALFRHDLRLLSRRSGDFAQMLLFFLVVILILPFVIGPDPVLLRRLGCGLIWLAAVLMSLLGLEQLFVEDARDGTLDLLVLARVPLPLIVAARLLTQAGTMLLALFLAAFPAFYALDLDPRVAPTLVASLLLGVPALVLLGGMMSAITVGIKRHPGLLTLLLIPFYIPVLIFAVGACDAALLGGSARPELLLLGALLAFFLPIAPFVIAAALFEGQG